MRIWPDKALILCAPFGISALGKLVAGKSRASRRLCSLSMTAGLHRRVSRRADWPRSEVMADTLPASWVSFRSCASIHLCYKRQPGVSAEPPQAADEPDNFLLWLVWLPFRDCCQAEVQGFFFTAGCVCVCDRGREGERKKVRNA